MSTIHPELALQIYRLRALLRTFKGQLPCLGCSAKKQASPQWGVAAFQPFAPGKRAGVYVLCPDCSSTKKTRDRAAQYAETALRDIDESKVSTW